MHPRRSRLWLLVLLAVLVAQVGLTWPARADSGDKTYYWEYFNADLTVLPNGDLDVVETLRYVFTRGTFTFAYRDIPLGRTEGIDQVWVAEGGQRYPTWQVQLQNVDGALRIRWSYPPTQNAARTFTIHYVAHGAIRIYDQGDQVWWKAIPADRGFPIRSSRVTVKLPAAVAPADLKMASYGARAESSILDPQTVVFTANNIPGGSELEVRVQFPHGLIHASPPSWQAAADRQAAYDEHVRPLVDLGVGVLSLLLLAGGTLGLIALWYTRGRDREVGQMAEYTAEPPSDLRPGLVGVLLDERVDMRDIIATMIDLARRGIIEMHEVDEPGFLGIGTHRDFVFRLLDTQAQVRPFEAAILHGIFGGGRERRLSDLKNRFYRALPGIRKRMYEEVVAAGLFPRSPETTRGLYLVAGLLLMFGSIVIGSLATPFLAAFTSIAFLPFAVLAVLGVLLMLAARFMPRRTSVGAEQAALWRAFRRYLDDIEKHTDLAQAKGLFDRYLPYAIAFGLDKEWIRKFAGVDAPAPTWYYPYPPVIIGGHPGRGHAPMPDLSSAGGPSVPSLEGMSQGLAGSLQSMSEGLTSLLNSASSTLASAPSSSSRGGGGWSGGGGRGGGGGGGGGAGAG